jgi:hypothetical protein
LLGFLLPFLFAAIGTAIRESELRVVGLAGICAPVCAATGLLIDATGPVLVDDQPMVVGPCGEAFYVSSSVAIALLVGASTLALMFVSYRAMRLHAR